MLPSYYDFPRCREAFATGQKDARLVESYGAYFRLRGRSSLSWTLLSFQNIDRIVEQLRYLKERGQKVKSLNYTYERPISVKVKKGPTEYITNNYDLSFKDRSKKTRYNLKQFQKVKLEIRVPTILEVKHVFDAWVEWAKTRHFMVFTGHYLQWLNLYFKDNGNCKLIGLYKDGNIVGLFGWEVYNGVTQVMIAKHLSTVSPYILWLKGLEQIGTGPILCGSTADHLKISLGLTPVESWEFDIGAL